MCYQSLAVALSGVSGSSTESLSLHNNAMFAFAPTSAVVSPVSSLTVAYTDIGVPHATVEFPADVDPYTLHGKVSLNASHCAVVPMHACLCALDNRARCAGWWQPSILNLSLVKSTSILFA